MEPICEFNVSAKQRAKEDQKRTTGECDQPYVMVELVTRSQDLDGTRTYFNKLASGGQGHQQSYLCKSADCGGRCTVFKNDDNYLYKRVTDHSAKCRQGGLERTQKQKESIMKTSLVRTIVPGPAPSSQCECYLIRHAHYCRVGPEQLTPIGIEQATAAGRYFALNEYQFDLILTSTAPRTRQTAKLMLREFSDYKRVIYADPEDPNGKWLDEIDGKSHETGLPSAEDQAAVDKIIAFVNSGYYGKILIISHATLIGSLFSQEVKPLFCSYIDFFRAMGSTWPDPIKLRLNHTSITKIAVREGLVYGCCLGSSTHIPNAKQTTMNATQTIGQ